MLQALSPLTSRDKPAKAEWRILGNAWLRASFDSFAVTKRLHVRRMPGEFIPFFFSFLSVIVVINQP